MHGDAAGVRAVWPKVLHALAEQPLLYVAVAAAAAQATLSPARFSACFAVSAGCLPRLGLLIETCQLLETAHAMGDDPSGRARRVTEFDRVFEIACRAVTQCLAVSSADWPAAVRTASRGKSVQSAADGTREFSARPTPD